MGDPTPAFMLSPTVIGDVELSSPAPSGSSKKLYRKQILPIGEFNYRGKKLDLSRARLEAMRQAWNDKAYDQIPFQLANEGNAHTHTKDPRYTEGELVDVEVDDVQGLVGTLALSEEGAKIVDKNPKLGVSAKINFNYVRDSDQAFFPAAIEHVLGTINPHLKGMSPWQEVVTLSDSGGVGDVGEYEDYSDAHYRTPVELTAYDKQAGADMGETKNADGTTNTTSHEGEGEPQTKQGGNGGTEETDDDEELKALLDELRNESDDDAGTTGVGTNTGEGEGGQAVGNQEYEAMALSVQEQGKQVAELTAQLNQEKWRREAEAYVHAGVPPSMVELAAPVMTAPETTTVELSDGKKSDSASIIRSILEEAKGTVDLSEETGHQDSGVHGDEDESFYKAALASLNH